MLAVLLKILATIGILLLVLLGLVLLLILIVLFVPITYKIKGRIQEDTKEVSIRLKWLFGLVRVSLDYSHTLTYQVKILWMDISEKTSAESFEDPLKDPSKVTYDSKVPKDEKYDNATTQATDETKKNLLFKIRSFCVKIKEIYQNINDYLDLIRQDDTKHLISHCLKVLLNILKSIRPGKMVLDLKFGFEAPDTTGKIYGLLCMLYPYYGKDIHIEPDFEKKILQGNIYLKGRIWVCVLLINALRILLDRKLYKVIHKLKNGGKRNGR